MPFKSLSQIQETIEILQNLNSSPGNNFEIRRQIENGFGAISIPVIDLRPETEIFRGATWDVMTVNDILYPPKHLVTVLGRANDIGQPMFYAALDEKTMLYEVSKNIGIGQSMIVTIAGFKTGSRIPLAIVVNMDRAKVEGNPNSEAHLVRLQELFSNFDDELKPRIELITKFFSDQFALEVKNEEYHKYELTSCYSMYCLVDGKRGVFYPSVQYKYGFNVAIDPCAVDNMIRPPFKIWKYKLTTNEDGSFDYPEPEKAKEIQNGRIIW